MSQTVIALETILLPLAQQFADLVLATLRATPKDKAEFEAALKQKDEAIAQLQSDLTSKVDTIAAYQTADNQGADLVVKVADIIRPVLNEALAATPSAGEALPEVPSSAAEEVAETAPAEDPTEDTSAVSAPESPDPSVEIPVEETDPDAEDTSAS
jgi:cell division septum initiation protein DivIVA